MTVRAEADELDLSGRDGPRTGDEAAELVRVELGIIGVSSLFVEKRTDTNNLCGTSPCIRRRSTSGVPIPISDPACRGYSTTRGSNPSTSMSSCLPSARARGSGWHGLRWRASRGWWSRPDSPRPPIVDGHFADEHIGALGILGGELIG